VNLRHVIALSLVAGPACTPPPTVPAHPTWADVAPILRGECAGCHGSTAATTGGGYRLDLYDATPDVCGEAARALGPVTLLASGAALLIAADTTPPPTGDRARMPPAPAPALTTWEREALARWAASPSKGAPPADNHAPVVSVGQLPAMVDGRLQFTAVTSDADDDPVVGVLKIADVLFAMNRSGAFAVDLDASKWPAGTQRLTATLCDGWSAATYDLGPVRVQH
jgi:hypothetical protein